MRIHQLLKMTRKEYEMLLLNWWTTYCFSKGYGPVQVQKLLTSQPLFNLWRAQLAAVESEFEKDVFPYESTSTKTDAKRLYAKHAYKLQKYYNSNLIDQALQ